MPPTRAQIHPAIANTNAVTRAARASFAGSSISTATPAKDT
jgi:hypothetical protein